MKKNKYKYKQKAMNGIQSVQPTGVPLAEKAVYKTQGSEGAATKGIEGVGKAVPIVGAFTAIGKTGYNMARNEDEYGVAKSDAGAATASVLAPHKAALRFKDRGDNTKAVFSALNPIYGGIQERKLDMQLREEAKLKEISDKNIANRSGQDVTFGQSEQIYGDGTQEIKTYKVSGKEYDSQSLLKKFLKQDVNSPTEYSTYQSQPEQVYRQALEDSDHPADVDMRSKLFQQDIANQDADAAQQKATFQYGLKQNNFLQQPTTQSDSTAVNKTYKYKMGTEGVENSKVVEAEKDELIFKKIGKTWRLKQDLKGGSTHEEGGEDVVVQNKDVIIPGKSRDKIMKMVDKNGYVKDTAQFNSYRLRLPKDKDVAKKGTEVEIPVRGENVNYMQSQPMTGGVTGLTNNYNIQPIATPTAMGQTAPTTGGGSNWGSYLQMGAQLAPSIYSMAKGLNKADKEPFNGYTPELLKYQDFSDPLRRESRQTLGLQAANARNLSAGSAGNLRANLNQASVDNFYRQQDINNNETARRLDILNQNSGTKNQGQLINNQEKVRVNQANQMNQAKKSEYIGRGLEGVSAYAFNQEQQSNLKKRDQLLVNTMGTTNFEPELDEKGNPTGKFLAKGSQYKLKK